MLERTETGYEVFPEGNYIFTASEAAEKRKTAKGKYYYLFRFKAVVDGRTKKYSEAMMTWMAGDLLRALKCKEISKGVFEWDKAEILNRQVRADIVHEPDFRDASKVVARLRNIVPAEGGVPADAPSDEPDESDGSTDGEIPF